MIFTSMILTFLNLPVLCQTIIDGAQISLLNNTEYQPYQYEQLFEDNQVQMFFNLKSINSSLQFYICRQTKKCYLNKTDEFHNMTQIKQSQHYSINLPLGTYYFVFKCMYAKCDVNISIGSAQLLQNRQSININLVEVNKTFRQQFYYYSCSNNSLNISLKKDFTYSITSNEATSFADLVSCQKGDNTFCNQSAGVINVTEQLYKIVVTGPQAQSFSIYAQQGDVYNLTMNGYVTNESEQRLSGFCGAFYKIDLQDDSQFNIITILPISSYGVVGVSAIKLSGYEDFTQNEPYYDNATLTKKELTTILNGSKSLYIYTYSVILNFMGLKSEIKVNQTLLISYDLILTQIGSTLVLNKSVLGENGENKSINLAVGHQFYFEFPFNGLYDSIINTSMNLQATEKQIICLISEDNNNVSLAPMYINNTPISVANITIDSPKPGLYATAVLINNTNNDSTNNDQRDLFYITNTSLTTSNVWIKSAYVHEMPVNVEFELTGYSVSGTYNFIFNLTEDDKKENIVIEASSEKGVIDIYFSKSNPAVDNIYFDKKSNQYGKATRLEINKDEISDSAFFIYIDTHSANTYVQVATESHATKVLQSGEEFTFSIDDAQNAEWVSTNSTQIDEALMKIQVDNSDASVMYIVSTMPIAETPEDSYLVNGVIKPGQNQIEIVFKTQHHGIHYIYFKTNKQTNITVQVVPLIELENDVAVTVTKAYGKYAYLRYNINYQQQLSLNVNLYNLAQVSAWLFDYTMPFSSQLNQENALNITSNLNQVDQRKIGYHYVIFNMSDIDDTARIVVTVEKNHLGSPGQRQIIKMDGESYKYVTIDFGVNVSEKQDIVFKIIQCDNCAGCLSFSFQQPNFKRFDNATEYTNCDMIIGNTSIEDLYDQTGIINGVGQRYAYLSFQSLGPLGQVEQIDYFVDYLHTMEADKQLNATLVPLGQENSTNVSRLSTSVVLACEDIKVRNENYTFIVAPQQPSRAVYHQAYYSIYYSLYDPFPSITTSNGMLINGNGLASLNIDITLLNAICGQGDNLTLFFTVAASSEMSTAVNISAQLVSNKNYVQNPVKMANDSITVGASIDEKRIIEFNADVLPVNVIISQCYGSIRYRAGITDFFMRTNFSKNDTNNEGILIQPAPISGGDIVFSIQKGTLYQALGSWYLELSDYGQNQNNTNSSRNQWKAEVFVGVQDIRPGIPVRKLNFGHRKGGKNLVVRVTNAVPKGLGTEVLEYGMFILPSKLVDDGSQIYYNPNATCAYKEGLQIMQFRQIISANSYYQEFEQDVDNGAITKYLKDKNNGNQTVYLTVIVRQPSTGLSNLYNAELVNLSDLPALEDLDVTKVNIGAIVGTTVAIIIAVGIIVFMVIYFQKRKKQNPYQQM